MSDIAKGISKKNKYRYLMNGFREVPSRYQMCVVELYCGAAKPLREGG